MSASSDQDSTGSGEGKADGVPVGIGVSVVQQADTELAPGTASTDTASSVARSLLAQFSRPDASPIDLGPDTGSRIGQPRSHGQQLAGRQSTGDGAVDDDSAILRALEGSEASDADVIQVCSALVSAMVCLEPVCSTAHK
jgi:hypothetical protein